jgi:hypothetical protein
MEYKACEDCKYFMDWKLKEEEEYDGECRFNPPSAFDKQNGKVFREYSPGRWPAVFRFTSCGKFEAK